MTPSHVERAATVDRSAPVWVDSIDHASPTDPRYHLKFHTLGEACAWASRKVARLYRHGFPIRLRIYRRWPSGPGYQETLAIYASIPEYPPEDVTPTPIT